MCRVTKGHLRVTICHLRVTVGHPRVTVGHPRVIIGHLVDCQLSISIVDYRYRHISISFLILLFLRRKLRNIRFAYIGIFSDLENSGNLH